MIVHVMQFHSNHGLWYKEIITYFSFPLFNSGNCCWASIPLYKCVNYI